MQASTSKRESAAQLTWSTAPPTPWSPASVGGQAESLLGVRLAVGRPGHHDLGVARGACQPFLKLADSAAEGVPHLRQALRPKNEEEHAE